MLKNIKKEKPEKEGDYLVLIEPDTYRVYWYKPKIDYWFDQEHEGLQGIVLYWDYLPALPKDITKHST